MNMKAVGMTLLFASATLVLALLSGAISGGKSQESDNESAKDVAQEIARKDMEYIRDCRGNNDCLKANPYRSYQFK